MNNMIWGIIVHLKLALYMAASSKPKEVFRLPFVWGFLFQNKKFATPENKQTNIVVYKYNSAC